MPGENMMESISQRTCPVCGKTFTVLWPLQWGYRRGEGSNRKYLCSWSCIRLFDKGETKMGLTKVTDAQKAKAVEIAIEGGDPIKFLDETGVTENAAGMWFTIKKKLKETDPDTYDRLPAKYKPVQKKEAPKEAAEETEAADEKPKITKPVNYGGYDVSAIRHPNLGEFYYDRKYHSLDWRTPDGEETSLHPAMWREMLKRMPEIMDILGVEE